MTPIYISFGRDRVAKVFSPSTFLVIEFISHAILVVFGLDCILGFRKAFLNEYDGRECRDPKLIAKHYIKT
jgi:hypothetical protein